SPEPSWPGTSAGANSRGTHEKRAVRCIPTALFFADTAGKRGCYCSFFFLFFPATANGTMPIAMVRMPMLAVPVSMMGLFFTRTMTPGEPGTDCAALSAAPADGLCQRQPHAGQCGYSYWP